MAWSKRRIAAVACGVIVLVVLNTLPVLSGVLAEGLHLTASDIGTYGSAETIGIALGAFAAAFALRRISPRLAAACGLAMLGGADLASFWLPSLSQLAAARWVGGFGTGLTLGACFLVYGESHREQNFAMYGIGQTALALVAIALVPAITTAFGWRALFLGLALLIAPALLLVRYFPPDAASVVIAAPSGPQRPRLSVPIWIALGGVAAFFAGQGALWTFLETIGLASGIRAESVHTAMTVCAASGVCGAVAVIAMAERIGPLPPLIGSVALTVAAVTVIQSRSPWIYTASISAFYFCLPIFAAYQFGVIAGADRSGHAAVLTSSATFGGFAVAPYLGGQLAERFGYGSLQLLDGGMMFAASLTLLALCGTWNRSL